MPTLLSSRIAKLALCASDLRIGEVIALEWPDLDLVANTITVERQERQGVVGPPKGGKPRTVPMTARLAAHLRGVPRIRTGASWRAWARR